MRFAIVSALLLAACSAAPHPGQDLKQFEDPDQRAARDAFLLWQQGGARKATESACSSALKDAWT